MVRASFRLLISSVVLGAASVACSAKPAMPPLIDSANAQRSAQNQTLTTSRRTAIVDAAARVARSVVSISVVSRRQVPAGDPMDFFSFFVPRTQERQIQGYGTGFVVRPGGIIITNQHVVDNADSITVSLADGRDFTARLLGEDPTTDIAVLRITEDLPVAAIGKSTDILIGEWVVALGNPYTYLLGNSEPTVTAGVVSATRRNVLPNNTQSGLYLDMIQTDASINPGNSGGPLTNSLGEVIGVNSFIFSNSGGSIGLGFAIPIERAIRVADEIVKSGAVRRAWTGLTVGDASSMRDWKSAGGVRIAEVTPAGPAVRAGLEAGAVLVEAAGRRLRNYLDWEAVKLDLHVGDTVAVRFKRTPAGAVESRRIITGDLPSVTAARVSVISGLELITVTPGVQAERQIRSDQGALIFRITDEVSRATGLREGDVIRWINRRPIATAAEVKSELGALGSQQAFTITFERQGNVASTTLSFR
ncbi:MAG: PDZ domain-containing protein [Gemmatimonadetes bacterium]|nr:PDZ domain-containing protein [Gemmatimonadota bacterium]